jgi:hypothetical protein
MTYTLFTELSRAKFKHGFELVNLRLLFDCDRE